jgi:hypothetical protein
MDDRKIIRNERYFVITFSFIYNAGIDQPFRAGQIRFIS